MNKSVHSERTARNFAGFNGCFVRGMEEIMKRNSDFLLSKVAGTQVLVPVGAAVADFSGIITLNETGAFLWELLGSECSVQELTQAMTNEYQVSDTQAAADVESFLEKLRSVGAIR